MSEYIVQDGGARLDQWLAAHHGELSRARWQSLIRGGSVTRNGKPCTPNDTVRAGDRISFTIPEAKSVDVAAEEIPLAVLFEDADIIVVNKPPGLVVHPAPGHDSGTLVNALLHHCKDLKGIGGELRPGIVHRLDRDTSGALVVAKNEQSMEHLAAQFKNRETNKEYLALVRGVPRPARGTIKTLIGRSANDRKKMSARVKRGREAVSHYEIMESFKDAALLRVRIETGRTHQIRVHLAHLGHPVLGDVMYGRAAGAPRQMLHAEKLAFTHPRTGKAMRVVAPMPADMAAAIQGLRADLPS